jgi:hypothetical protein
MSRSIKDQHLAGNSAVPSDRDSLPDREPACMTDSGVITDHQGWAIGEAGTKQKRAFAIYQNIITDYELAAALYPMQENSSVQVSTIASAVSFEQRFADKHPDHKVIGRTDD